MNGWVVFGLLVGAYALFYYAVGVRRLARGFEPVGPLLLWKTQAGVRVMERLAGARRFWAVFGDLGIAATVTMAALMLLLLVLQLVAFLDDPVRVSEAAPPAITLVGLPGVNPIIPLWFGLAGLVVALVVHEGAHGVLARLGRMRVRSTGLLLLVVPVGAFVEPDERDLERSTLRARNRVFAAGPWSNLVVAIVAGVLFSSVFVSAMAPPASQGVTVGSVNEGSAADAAGLQAGDVLLALVGDFGNATDANGTANATARERLAFGNQTAFSQAMNRTSANQTVVFEVLRGGAPLEVEATLGDRHAAQASAGGEPPEWTRGKGFLGVVTLDAAMLRSLRDALADPFSQGGVGLFFFYPLFVFTEGVDILSPPYAPLYTVQGPLAALPDGLFFGLANLLYWIFWLNLMLGTFNALPAGPLDGGHIFRASVREWLWRRLGVDRSRLVYEARSLDADLAGAVGAAQVLDPTGVADATPGEAPGRLVVRGADAETQAKLDRAQSMLRRVTATVSWSILFLVLLPLLARPLVGLFT